MNRNKHTPTKKQPLLRPEDNERELSGGILFDPDGCLREIEDVGLTSGHFIIENCVHVFAAVERLKANGTPITQSAIINESGISNNEAAQLIEKACMPAAARYHALNVRAESLKYRTIDALRKTGGEVALRMALENALDSLPEDNRGGKALTPLADLADPTPEAENPAALFRGGWLRKGGGAFLVSLAGQGKSTWTIQAATCWAMGRAAFGIEPVRPLHIAIVQSEDDAEEVAHFRNQIAEGLATEGGLDPAEIRAAMEKGVMLCDMTGATGDAFIERLTGLLKAHPEIDLVIINPFQSYFGGDVSHNAELTKFLRADLDPLIKPNRAGVLFVHHTNKPPNAKERGGWGTDAFAAYVGAGGAELINWARAMLALMPVENLPGVFRLVAGKRGQRLGWGDATGAKTNLRLIAHHDRLIYWRAATEAEAEAVQGEGVAGSKRGDEKADAETLAVVAQGTPQRMTDLRAYASEYFGSGRGRRAFVHLRDHAAAFKVSIVPAKWKGAAFIGTRPEAEAAARKWDTDKPK